VEYLPAVASAGAGGGSSMLTKFDPRANFLKGRGFSRAANAAKITAAFSR